MKQIITIQHTQSIHHTNGMVGSWTDWDLSELGIEQAEKVGTLQHGNHVGILLAAVEQKIRHRLAREGKAVAFVNLVGAGED